MRHLTAALLIVIAIAAIAIGALARANARLSERAERAEGNVETLMDSVTLFRAKDNIKAARIRSLRLTLSELRESQERLAKKAKAVGVRPRDVQTVTELATATQMTFAPETVFVQADRPTLAYSDAWLTFAMDTAVRLRLMDTVTVIRHAKTRRFLWWTWKRYSGEVTVMTACPYSEPVTALDIKIEQ